MQYFPAEKKKKKKKKKKTESKRKLMYYLPSLTHLLTKTRFPLAVRIFNTVINLR